MAVKMRSAVMALIAEDTEGLLKAISSGAQFTALRQGFSVDLNVNTVDSDELLDDIGRTGSFVTNENPTASVPKYLKGSGVEGQAPDWAPLMKSAFGAQTDISTELLTESSSSAGSSSARGYLQFDTDEADNVAIGRAFLIKDAANGYSIRNAHSLDTDNDRVNLNYNLGTAPGTDVGTGKPIIWSPVADGHPTNSLHLWQGSSSAKFYQAIAGIRTTGFNVNLQANGLAEIQFDLEGLRGFLNPIYISSSNKYLDFDDDGSTEVSAIISEGWYNNPHELASEIQTKMDALVSDTITVTFDDTTGKFIIASDGSTLNLLWDSGTNTASTIGTTIGFAVAADDGSATTYTADSALTYDPGQTPAFDSNDPFVVKNQEFLIGDFFRTEQRKGANTTINFSAPKSVVPDFTNESGQSESLVNERVVTLSSTLTYRIHMVDQFHAMLNNQSQSLMFNCGVKDSSGNWVPGKCFNVWMAEANITSHVLSEQDGYVVVQIEASGKVTSTFKDVYFNAL